MAKLVREGTEELFAGRTLTATFDIPVPARRIPLLHSKLLEEIGELIAADSRENLVQELADVQEVLWAIADAHDVSPVDIHTEAIAKSRKRGGFENLVWMDFEDVEVPKIEYVSSSDRRYGSWDGVGYSG